MKVGVLAFQGDIVEHLRALKKLGVESAKVRSVEDLQKVDALIIPGGESTVIEKFLVETGVGEALKARHEQESFPIFGTCAGAIILAEFMNVELERNAYGRQTDSFEEDIAVHLPSSDITVRGSFIRAPRVTSVEKGVEVLAEHQGTPVLYQQGNLLASTFHPELLSEPSAIHRYFLLEICAKQAIAV